MYSEPKLFNVKDRHPQYPSKCILPSEEAKEKRRRLGEGIPKFAAEKACAHYEQQQSKDACISDVIAMGDLEFAQKVPY